MDNVVENLKALIEEIAPQYQDCLDFIMQEHSSWLSAPSAVVQAFQIVSLKHTLDYLIENNSSKKNNILHLVPKTAIDFT